MTVVDPDLTLDIDALLDAVPPEPVDSVTLVPSPPRCRHERRKLLVETGELECVRCLRIVPLERSRSGASARRRGVRYELELAKRMGGTKVGHHGGAADVLTPMFAVQSKVRKAFPGWMWDELAKLPRTGGRVPLLVVADSPGSAGTRRAVVVVELADWIALHGTDGVAP